MKRLSLSLNHPAVIAEVSVVMIIPDCPRLLFRLLLLLGEIEALIISIVRGKVITEDLAMRPMCGVVEAHMLSKIC